MTAVKISATVITFNEEKNIARCIDSMSGIVDEIIIIDSFSEDSTEEICRDKGATFIQHEFEGHIEQKNFAVSQTNYNIVLSLDADEALSEKLRSSIKKVKEELNKDGYYMNRMTSYCGQWIKHSGWYPDRKLRLWDKTKGHWGGENPHDKVIMDEGCAIGHLVGDILHYSFPSIRDHLITANKFSEIAAKEAVAKGKHVNILYHIILNPFYTFINRYFIRLGFLDGFYGFVISVISAFSNFLKYSKIRYYLRQHDSQKNNHQSYG